MDIRDVKIDKTAFQVFSSFEEADEADRNHWRDASPDMRLLALELMRQSAYGYTDPATPRLQRVLEIEVDGAIINGGSPVSQKGKKASGHPKDINDVLER